MHTDTLTLRPVVHASGTGPRSFSACGIPAAAAPVGARRSTLAAAVTCPACLALAAGVAPVERYSSSTLQPVGVA